MIRRCFTGAGLLAAVAGCPSDLTPVEGDGGAGGEVPPVVQAVFDRRCAVAGCHGMGAAQGGLSLDAAASGSIVGGPSSAGIPMVTVGSICDSYLAIKILPKENNGCAVQASGSLMPPGGRDDPEVQVDLALLLGWISGADLSGAGGGTGGGGSGSGSTASGDTGTAGTGAASTGTAGGDGGTAATGP